MSTEIAVIDKGTYLALNHSTAELQEIIQDNLAGQTVGEFDLPQVKMPAGGGRAWEIPTLTGIESATELSGIVLFHKRTRAYWREDEPNGSPPDCRSADTIVGVGDPGGQCLTCPLAQFGSSSDGRGQACGEKEIWFILREGSFLPLVLAMPATSLKAAKAYRLQLASGAIRLPQVVTTIALEKARNAGGQDYSKAVPTLGAKLDPDAAQAASAYAGMLRPVFEAAAAAVTTETAAPAGDDTPED